MADAPARPGFLLLTGRATLQVSRHGESGKGEERETDLENRNPPGGGAAFPEFTDEEQYVVSFYKSQQPTGVLSALSNDLPYLVPNLIIAGLGVYFESIAVLVAAFIVLVGFKAREAYYQPRYHEITRSILFKYEQRARHLQQQIRTEESAGKTP